MAKKEKTNQSRPFIKDGDIHGLGFELPNKPIEKPKTTDPDKGKEKK